MQPTGAKWWRYRFRFNGKANMLSLGTYPEISLKQAGQEKGRFRALLNQGINPSLQRQEDTLLAKVAHENSFETVARQWWESWREARNPEYALKTLRRLEADVFSVIGTKPVNEIAAPLLVSWLKK